MEDSVFIFMSKNLRTMKLLYRVFCIQYLFHENSRETASYGIVNDKILGNIVLKIITYVRKEMKDVWENTIWKAHNRMLDETSGLVGIEEKQVDHESLEYR